VLGKGWKAEDFVHCAIPITALDIAVTVRLL